VIGHDTARLLAGHGAQLLHSAPSVGVKDWSDLRIAVAAGVWLGTARPGDILEIITDDRAFDAVGDVATGLGVAFRRLSYRGLTGLPREAEPVVAADEPRAESTGSGGRRRRGRRGSFGRREAPPPLAASPPSPRLIAPEEPHTAPHDELLGVAREMIRRAANGAVTLDALANALKGRGFSRTPGSPRLITRLRRIRELAVSRSGHITLVETHAPAPASPRPEPIGEPADNGPVDNGPVDREPVDGELVDMEPVEVEPVPVPSVPARAERRSPGDEQSLEARRAAVAAAQTSGQSAPSVPEAQPPASSGPRDDGDSRRRSRRGGRRRRRRHGAPASG
jgi:hypothetical protein